MMKDPIVEEVRAVRAEMLKQAGGTLAGLAAAVLLPLPSSSSTTSDTITSKYLRRFSHHARVTS